MSYQPPPNYVPPGSGQPPQSSGGITLIITVFGVIAAWLAMPSTWFTQEIRRDWFGLGWSDHVVEKPAPPPAGPSLLPRANREDGAMVFIGGVWRSNSRSGITYIFQQSSNSIEIYQDHPTRGQVKIGSGFVNSGIVRATIRTIKEDRVAELTLYLSEDGQQLSGTFKGTAASEVGPISLSRVGPNIPAG